MISCLNNGLIILKYEEDIKNKDIDLSNKQNYHLEITSIIEAVGIGRIFTEKAFRNIGTTFNFFT